MRTPIQRVAAWLVLTVAGCTAQSTGSSSSSGGDGTTSSSSSSSGATSQATSNASNGTSAATSRTSSSTGATSASTSGGVSGTSGAATSSGGVTSGVSQAGSGGQASSGPVLSSNKDITTFQIDGVDGVITGTSIVVTLPATSDASNLTPTVSITGVSVSPASNTAQDFTQPVTYTVTAEDGSTRAYVVTVQRLPVRPDQGAIIPLNSGPGAGAKVDLPAGALGMETVITVENGTPLTGVDGDALGPPIRLGPSGTQFSVPVQVTVPFSGAAGPEQTLAVLKRNDDTQEITSLEIVGNSGTTLTALTSSFSTVQVVAVNNPAITTFGADTTLLPAVGGEVTLTWATTRTARQALAISPSTSVTLPPLTGSSSSARVRLPGNPTATPVRYSLTLTATGAMGSTAATRTVVLTVGSNVNDIYTKVVSGWGHWLALRNDGQVVSWGDNSVFQAAVPQDLSAVVDIAAHATNSLALRADGTVVMWGDDNRGRYVVPAGLTGVTAMAMGETHSLAVRQDGTVVSWFSDNGAGQANVPAGLAGVVAVAAGSIHSLALKADGTVVGWGTDTAATGGIISGPMALTGVRSIAAGRLGSLVITEDGQAHYFGYVGFGAYPAPTADRLRDAIKVDASSYTRCVLKRDGSVVAWTNFADPTFAAPAGSLGWVDVAAGSDYCVGLKADGSLDFISKPTVLLPFVAIGMKDAVQVSVSQQSHLTENRLRSHTVVLRRDGTVVGWLNGGDLTSSGCATLGVPVGLSNITQVSAGGAHGLALKADGMVTAWGCGEATNVPMDLANVTSVAAGGDFSMALKQDGSVAVWGSTIGDAILGATSYPPPTGEFTPTIQPAEPLTGIKAIAAGANAALALRMDGTVVAWGRLGFNPVAPPPGLSNVMAISISGLNAIALKEDGTVVVWGRTYGFGADPASLTNVQAVAAGSSSNQASEATPFAGSRWFAVLADGTVTGAGSTRWRQTEGAQVYRGVVQVSSGENTSAAVLFDGSVKSWGYMVVGGQSRPLPLPPDADMDGYSPPLDCNDFNPAINPGVTQDMAGNMVDENCDGVDGLAGP